MPNQELRRGPYGLVSPSGNPMCEECDVEMHPFAAQEGDRIVEGYGCDECGHSFDVPLSISLVDAAPNDPSCSDEDAALAMIVPAVG